MKRLIIAILTISLVATVLSCTPAPDRTSLVPTDNTTSSDDVPSSEKQDTEPFTPTEEAPTTTEIEENTSQTETTTKQTGDIGKEIAKDGFSIIVEEVRKNGQNYEVIVILTLGETQNLWATNRFRLVNSQKETLYLTNLWDEGGNNMNGADIEIGTTLKLKAEFELPEGFVPVQFRYVYDIQGFRDLRAQLE